MIRIASVRLDDTTKALYRQVALALHEQHPSLASPETCVIRILHMGYVLPNGEGKIGASTLARATELRGEVHVVAHVHFGERDSGERCAGGTGRDGSSSGSAGGDDSDGGDGGDREAKARRRAERLEVGAPADLPEKPHEFYCPILKMVMRDPVVAADGHTYERSALKRHLEESRVLFSPMTGAKMDSTMIDNTALRILIQEWTELIHAAVMSTARAAREHLGADGTAEAPHGHGGGDDDSGGSTTTTRS